MKVLGDNDLVDVVEIGFSVLVMGLVMLVKFVGVYVMIDDGEFDWKVIAISVNDSKASDINDVVDVEKYFLGEFEKICVWFCDYKILDGKL